MNYNDNKKNHNYYFKIHEVIIMVAAACFLSFFAGSTIMELKMNRNKDTNNVSKKAKDDAYINKFIENYDYIIKNYYKEVDRDKLINGAIAGMMSVLEDPYTVYMDDDANDNFNIVLEGSYNGVGIEIGEANNGQIFIVGVIKNSPASKAGLAAGDILIGIDDEDTSEYQSKDYSKYIAKSGKNEFVLKVLRNNEELEFTVTKELVNLESVASETFEKNNHKIGYIYISVFAANTDIQFADNLSKLEESGIDSLIIDVRGNNGGHLSSAAGISSLFVDKSHIIYKLKKNGKVTSYKSSGRENKEYPIVVLVDENSASASELLTGCLRDNLKATIIGKKTYGKGSVQELINLSNGDQYKITTKEWLTPNGTKVNGVGIKPDIDIDLNEAYYTNPSNDTDNQLQEAINYLAK